MATDGAPGGVSRMTTSELIERLDGRPGSTLATLLGLSNQSASAWTTGKREVPLRYTEKIRSRLPLPSEDRYEEGFKAGYNACKMDSQYAISQLTP